MGGPGYDIIGDIHGQVGKLTALLGRLGYRDETGVFRHPLRRAVFLGDFIDRGNNSRETLHIVRRMVREGGALAVMGNHEFDALLAHHRNPDPFRASDHGVGQRVGLSKTLEEFVHHQDEWHEFLAWFRELPLFLELDGLRVVHAVWSTRAIAALGGCGVLSTEKSIEVMQPGSAANRAAQILLNGWQISLPADCFVEAFEGAVSKRIRLAWWKTEGPQTYRSLSVPFSSSLPETPLPAEVSAEFPGYGPAEEPLFLGHYSLSPDEAPWPLAPNLACVDYRAARRGPLVAYRWDGEQVLAPGKFAQ